MGYETMGSDWVLVSIVGVVTWRGLSGAGGISFSPSFSVVDVDARAADPALSIPVTDWCGGGNGTSTGGGSGDVDLFGGNNWSSTPSWGEEVEEDMQLASWEFLSFLLWYR